MAELPDAKSFDYMIHSANMRHMLNRKEAIDFQRALIVRQPYANFIVEGQKTLEMRSRHTKIRERVGIIPKGSGLITGSVEIVGSWGFSEEGRLKSIGGQVVHCIEPEDWHLLDKWCIGWGLANPKRFKKPIPYNHPKGAVTWVKIDSDE